MAQSLFCDGFRRRDFIKVGLLGGAGFSLANYLQLAAAGEVKTTKAQAAIFIHLSGGPSHMDTFDLKPNAPAEYRGTFNPIKTNVPGVEISEHLPNLAKCADKFSILRGVSHTLGDHRLGTEYVNSGSRPLPSIEYPGYGAVMNRELTADLDMPSAVSINNASQRAGFLGVKYAPLNTGSTPVAGKPFNVRGLALGNGLTVEEVEHRQNLLKDLDSTFAGFEKQNQLLDGLDRFGRQAHSMITSKRARDAFDLSQENPKFSETFGTHGFGMSCLLATRLVASGVKFVTLSMGGWDTHQTNFTNLKTKQLPPFDQGLSALFNGLAEKGLLESTVVFVTGEFGRTPKINSRAAEGGRDHYPRCMFMLLGGGGIRGGQALGESDEKASMPANEGFSPDDVAASFYRALGIDHTKEYHTNTGRPISIVRDGQVIEKLFS
jgi:uncharacterized protein (DUF1501 family)